MLNVKELKDQLNINDYKLIMQTLGADIKKETDNEIIYMTGDHHLNWDDGSPKLYFYKDTQTFFSYTASCSFDIIGLIQKRWDMEGLDYQFKDIIHYIMQIVGLTTDNIQIAYKQKPSWKMSLLKYTSSNKPHNIDKIYDTQTLDCILPYYHPLFLNDGITIDTMQKFNIGWYASECQITLPVYAEDGSLLGVHCRNTNPVLVNKGYKYIPLKTSQEHYKFKTSDVLYGLNVNAPMINHTQQILLFEAPKSVLQMDSMFHESNSVGLFGMNVSKRQRDMILEHDVSEVVICLDKQYQDTSGDEWDKYVKTINKIAKLFTGFVNVSVVADMDNLLDYKDSPSDKGVDIFNQLFQKRYKL